MRSVKHYEWILPCLLLLSACATPRVMRGVNASDMARLEPGMSVKAARHAAGTSGEPIALFLDRGQRFEIRTYMVRETGARYHVPWIDGALQSVLPADKSVSLEARPPQPGDPSSLPHENGFQVLLEAFAAASAPSDVDFAQPRDGFHPRDKKQERAELVMWTPVVLVLLPVMPIQLMSVGVSAAGHDPYYDLDLGWSPERVRKRIGDPKEVVGDPSDYGVMPEWAMAQDGSRRAAS